MSLPESLHSQEYLDQLVDLRDAALRESNYYGRRRQLGRLSYGEANALWRNESGGSTFLQDRGIRFGKVSLLINPHPTTLMIFDHHDNGLSELTEFRMDLDVIESIEVYRTMFTSASFTDVFKYKMAQRQERRLDFVNPADEDRVRLYEEMQRGATGLYTEC
jgi:hypothetical protein